MRIARLVVAAVVVLCGWVVSAPPASAAPSTRIVAVTQGGLFLKEPGLTSPWVQLKSGSLGQAKAAANRIAVLENGSGGVGTLWVKEGPWDAAWVRVADGVVDYDIAGDRVAIILASRALYVKEGPLNAGWKHLADGVSLVALSPHRVAIGRIYAYNCQPLSGLECNPARLEVKEYSLDAPWHVVADGINTLYAGTHGWPIAWSIAVTDSRVGYGQDSLGLLVKEGPLNASWIKVRGPGYQWNWAMHADRLCVTQGTAIDCKTGSLKARFVRVRVSAQNPNGLTMGENRLAWLEGSKEVGQQVSAFAYQGAVDRSLVGVVRIMDPADEVFAQHE